MYPDLKKQSRKPTICHKTADGVAGDIVPGYRWLGIAVRRSKNKSRYQDNDSLQFIATYGQEELELPSF